MSHAANAYARASQMVQTPRELEAAILLKSATRLQAIHDDWEGRSGELPEALGYNRKLWTLLATGATDADHPLPPEVKRSVGELAAFVFRHSFSLLAEPDAAKLGVLVNINRELAAGLRTSARQAA